AGRLIGPGDAVDKRDYHRHTTPSPVTCRNSQNASAATFGSNVRGPPSGLYSTLTVPRNRRPPMWSSKRPPTRATRRPFDKSGVLPSAAEGTTVAHVRRFTPPGSGSVGLTSIRSGTVR